MPKATMFRKLREGDAIVNMGIRYEIVEILNQDFFYPDEDDVLIDGKWQSSGTQPYINLEFRDQDGKYHRWNSCKHSGMIDYKLCMDKSKLAESIADQNEFQYKDGESTLSLTFIRDKHPSGKPACTWKVKDGAGDQICMVDVREEFNPEYRDLIIFITNARPNCKVFYLDVIENKGKRDYKVHAVK